MASFTNLHNSLSFLTWQAPDIRHIRWGQLHAAGLRAVVFDKDNTVTAPYATEVHGPLQNAIENCIQVFGAVSRLVLRSFPLESWPSRCATGADRVAVLSNSAGSSDDQGFAEAGRFEEALGLPVIRHGAKKPSKSCAESVFGHLGAAPHEVVMVGDRTLTDVVFGNLFGMFTVKTRLFDGTGDPGVVVYARQLEDWLAQRSAEAGVTPVAHPFSHLVKHAVGPFSFWVCQSLTCLTFLNYSDQAGFGYYIIFTISQGHIGSREGLSMGDKAYWESFYDGHVARGSGESFEWFLGSAAAARLLREELSPRSRVLHLGAGMSDLGPLLDAAGLDVVNVDYDRAAVCGSPLLL
jgi:phosphatidylglycerophosphatase GEP4